jgi:outer membrane lipoprotein carrier protein
LIMKPLICRNKAILFFLVCGFAIFRPLLCHADSPLVVAEILKKTGATYQQTQAFSANFHQSVTSVAASSMATEASGKLFYEKPRQMRWEYEKPEPQVFVANHQFAWLYVPSEKQISLSDSKKIFSHPLAQTFFEGVAELKKHYQVTLDNTRSGKELAVLKLVPKNEDPEIKTLYLSIDLRTYRISIIEVQNVLGNINRISLDSQRAVVSLDPKLFQLDIPPSVDIVDAEGRPLTPAEVEKLKHQLPLAPDR